MEDGLYLVCPKCGRINKGEGWTVIYKEYNLHNVFIDDEDNELYTSYDDTLDTETEKVEHYCGFETHSYTIDDFVILVKNNMITEVGDYWVDHPDELESIASKYGLKVKIE